MQGGLVRRKVSVRLSIRRVRLFSQRKICPGFYTVRTIIEILCQPAPFGKKSPISNRYSLVAPKPEHLAKKVQLTLIESPLRVFQWA